MQYRLLYNFKDSLIKHGSSKKEWSRKWEMSQFIIAGTRAIVTGFLTCLISCSPKKAYCHPIQISAGQRHELVISFGTNYVEHTTVIFCLWVHYDRQCSNAKHCKGLTPHSSNTISHTKGIWCSTIRTVSWHWLCFYLLIF